MFKMPLQQYYSSSLKNLALRVIKRSLRDNDLENKTGKRSSKKSPQNVDSKDNVDTEVIMLIFRKKMTPRPCGKKSDAPFPATRSSESQSCMSVSCICICLNTRKTVSTSLVPGPGKSFFNSEKLLLSLPPQSSMDAKRVHIFMYIQSRMTPGAFGLKKVFELVLYVSRVLTSWAACLRAGFECLHKMCNSHVLYFRNVLNS